MRESHIYTKIRNKHKETKQRHKLGTDFYLQCSEWYIYLFIFWLLSSDFQPKCP